MKLDCHGTAGKVEGAKKAGIAKKRSAKETWHWCSARFISMLVFNIYPIRNRSGKNDKNFSTCKFKIIRLWKSWMYGHFTSQ